MICSEGLLVSSINVFDDFNAVTYLTDFFNSCRVDSIAQLKQDREQLTSKVSVLQTQEPQLTSAIQEFLNISLDLLNRIDYYSQDSGVAVLQWLSQVDRLLVATESIIKEALGDLVASDTESTWPYDFAVYTVFRILERTRRNVQRNRITLRSRYSLVREVRQRTLLALANTFCYFLMILCTLVNVKEEKESPTRILEITGEALSQIR
jgi:hypothetical protein